VNVRLVITPSSRRVYTLTLALAAGLGVAAAAVGCGAPAPNAQSRVSADAQMTKGPATAAVTIVEFSDYQ
jgi:hypothetical protein